jgi:hypothetical protein
MPSLPGPVDIPVCSAVSFVKPIAGPLKHRDFKIDEPLKINELRECPLPQI